MFDRYIMLVNELLLKKVPSFVPVSILFFQCMRSKTAAELDTAWGSFGEGWERWTPVRDNNVFPDRLENLALKRSSISALIGVCHDESLAFGCEFLDSAD